MAEVKAQVYIGYDFDVDGVYDGLSAQERAAVAAAIEAPIKNYFGKSLPSWESVSIGNTVDGLVPIDEIVSALTTLLETRNANAPTQNQPIFRLDSTRGRGMFSVHRRFRDGLRRYGLNEIVGDNSEKWVLTAQVGGHLIATEPYIAAYWTVDWVSDDSNPGHHETAADIAPTNRATDRDLSGKRATPSGRRGREQDFATRRSSGGGRSRGR